MTTPLADRCDLAARVVTSAGAAPRAVLCSTVLSPRRPRAHRPLTARARAADDSAPFFGAAKNRAEPPRNSALTGQRVTRSQWHDRRRNRGWWVTATAATPPPPLPPRRRRRPQTAGVRTRGTCACPRRLAPQQRRPPRAKRPPSRLLQLPCVPTRIERVVACPCRKRRDAFSGWPARRAGRQSRDLVQGEGRHWQRRGATAVVSRGAGSMQVCARRLRQRRRRYLMVRRPAVVPSTRPVLTPTQVVLSAGH